MNKTVVGLGEILWDLLPGGKVLGGAPANFACHVSQFGYDGFAVSAIGDDAPGDEILTVLADKKLNHLIEKVPFPTGTVRVTLDGAGVPSYEICENVAWDNIPFGEKSRELAARTSAVCFGTLAQRSEVSRRSIVGFLEAMPSGSHKIFDINLRQHFYTREVIEDSLKMSDILKINDEEAVVLSRLFGLDGDVQSVCRRVLDMYSLDMVILTCGSVGSWIFSGDGGGSCGRSGSRSGSGDGSGSGGGISYLPTPKVRVADTVGAGDSFTAAFIAAYMHGLPVAESHELAVRVAAWVCTRHGAMPELPDYFKLSSG
jgi:fructokinase